jgi:hypothetical protein
MRYGYGQTPYEPVPLGAGDRIFFAETPSKAFLVRAISENFVVVTRQADFKPKGDLCYLVIDWRNGVRGPINVIGQGWNVDTDEECRELCQLMEAGEWEISQRNWVYIRIAEVKK